MFGKKRKKEQRPVNQAMVNPTYYSAWQQDLGFLTLIMERNINIHKAVFINPYIKQVDGSGMIRDEDINESIVDIIEAVYKSLSDEYIEFLSTKYFNGEDALLSFISDHVYMQVLNNANDANVDKMKSIYQNKLISRVSDLNKKIRDTK